MTSELELYENSQAQQYDVLINRVKQTFHLRFIFDSHATREDAERKLAHIPEHSIVACEAAPHELADNPEVITDLGYVQRLTRAYYLGLIDEDRLDDAAENFDQALQHRLKNTPRDNSKKLTFPAHGASLFAGLLRKRCLVDNADAFSKTEHSKHGSLDEFGDMATSVYSLLSNPYAFRATETELLSNPDISVGHIIRTVLPLYKQDAFGMYVRERSLSIRLADIMLRMDAFAIHPGNRLHLLQRVANSKHLISIPFGVAHSYISWVRAREGYETSRVITSPERSFSFRNLLGRILALQAVNQLPKTVPHASLHKATYRAVTTVAVREALLKTADDVPFTYDGTLDSIIYKLDDGSVNGLATAARHILQQFEDKADEDIGGDIDTISGILDSANNTIKLRQKLDAMQSATL
jgi:hypothetical protein